MGETSQFPLGMEKSATGTKLTSGNDSGAGRFDWPQISKLRSFAYLAPDDRYRCIGLPKLRGLRLVAEVRRSQS